MASLSLGSLSLSGRGRRKYVLTIGEDCAVLTLYSGKTVKNAWIVPAEAAEGGAEIEAVLRKDPKTPVALLADTFEQIYRDEPVPRVGRMDQAKVTRRHAAVATPGDIWKAAMPQGRDPRGKKLFYLFCGLPRSEHVSAWVRLYEGLRNPKGGIHLLPLESLSLMNALFDSEAKARGGVRWRIMTTMNVSGGLRQIVAKQGRMMLTRLTPAPPEDMPADEAAAMMVRDFRQTLTYVKRMGYREGDALDLALIVDPDLAEALAAQQWEAESVNVTTPHAVGERLGLGSVGKPEQPYGDVLHAAWFARKAKPALTLTRPSEQKSELGQLGEALAPLGAVAAIGGVAFYAYTAGTALWDTHQRIERLEIALPAAQSRLQAVQAEHAALPYDAQVMRDTLALADTMAGADRPVVPFLRAIDAGLRNRAHVVRLELENGAVTQVQAANQGGGRGGSGGGSGQVGRGAPKGDDLWARLEMVLDDPATAEDALVLSDQIMQDLTAALPDAKVVLVRPPVAVLPDQTLSASVRMDTLYGTARTVAGPAADGGQAPGGPAGAGFTMRVEISRGAAS
ncbi:hypothetical protein [Caenispirillum salinarum]|uniref:hypothetical protein n=1 Tax=Caenispirillum salinarum TaxID=859058 RepID=UPI00384DF0D9